MTNTTKKKKLTKAEMRVAIAKDVIAQIKAKKYNPMQGCWVDQVDGDDYESWLLENAVGCEIDVQKYTKNIKKCKCGRPIHANYTRCAKCLKAFYKTTKGRLAERNAIPDRIYYPRYEVAT